MHEQGVAQELVAVVDRVVLAHAGTRASRVVVSVPGGAVDEQSFRAAFDIAKQATTAADAELALEPVALDGLCLGCGRPVRIDDTAHFTCPACASGRWRATSTTSVTLSSVEIEV